MSITPLREQFHHRNTHSAVQTLISVLRVLSKPLWQCQQLFGRKNVTQFTAPFRRGRCTEHIGERYAAQQHLLESIFRAEMWQLASEFAGATIVTSVAMRNITGPEAGREWTSARSHDRPAVFQEVVRPVWERQLLRVGAAARTHLAPALPQRAAPGG